jgi:hypothetical protein
MCILRYFVPLDLSQNYHFWQVDDQISDDEDQASPSTVNQSADDSTSESETEQPESISEPQTMSDSDTEISEIESMSDTESDSDSDSDQSENEYGQSNPSPHNQAAALGSVTKPANDHRVVDDPMTAVHKVRTKYALYFYKLFTVAGKISDEL